MPAPWRIRASGERAHRISQARSAVRQAENTRSIRGPEIVRVPTGLPRTAVASSQNIVGTVAEAIRHPAGFARHDGSIRPRTSQAKAVVIPHVGQSRPVALANAHGRSPSCVWVPNPLGSGWSARAVPSRPASIADAMASSPREEMLNLRRSSPRTSKAGPRFDTNDRRPANRPRRAFGQEAPSYRPAPGWQAQTGESENRFSPSSAEARSFPPDGFHALRGRPRIRSSASEQ